MLHFNFKNTLLLIALFACFIAAPQAASAQDEAQFTEDMIELIAKQAESKMQDSPYKDVMEFDLKCIIREMLTKAAEHKSDNFKELEELEDKAVTAYPNPAKSTDVTVEFLKEWPFQCPKPIVKSLAMTDLKLFRNDKLITDLTNFPVKDNKIIIPASLLKEEGTYTISDGRSANTVSFIVIK